MINFADVFKSSFLAQSGGPSANPLTFALSIVSIIVYAALIRVVYRHTYRGVMYSRTFGTALGVGVLVTGFIIMTISSNIVLSLGMVGALSIVRFRTAVKDAMDVIYMFWAVGLGIAAGGGLFAVAALLFVVVALFLIVTAREGLFTQPYLFVVSCDGEDCEKEVLALISPAVRKLSLRGKTVRGTERELTVEVVLGREGDTSFVARAAAVKGVGSASLIGCDGDVSV